MIPIVEFQNYMSESSENCDDSSDEDFTSGAIMSDRSEVEASLEKKHGPRTTTAPCHPNNTLCFIDQALREPRYCWAGNSHH